jgi:hypothetical protein
MKINGRKATWWTEVQASGGRPGIMSRGESTWNKPEL